MTSIIFGGLMLVSLGACCSDSSDVRVPWTFCGAGISSVETRSDSDWILWTSPWQRWPDESDVVVTDLSGDGVLVHPEELPPSAAVAVSAPPARVMVVGRREMAFARLPSGIVDSRLQRYSDDVLFGQGQESWFEGHLVRYGSGAACCHIGGDLWAVAESDGALYFVREGVQAPERRVMLRRGRGYRPQACLFDPRSRRIIVTSRSLNRDMAPLDWVEFVDADTGQLVRSIEVESGEIDADPALIGASLFLPTQGELRGVLMIDVDSFSTRFIQHPEGRRVRAICSGHADGEVMLGAFQTTEGGRTPAVFLERWRADEETMTRLDVMEVEGAHAVFDLAPVGTAGLFALCSMPGYAGFVEYRGARGEE